MLQNTDHQPRPDWDHYFLLAAEWASLRATCPRRHVGAVLVQDHRVIASGYNGSERGAPHCTDEGVGCLMVEGHCERTVHAELNCILQAAEAGIAVAGATMYCTVNPCFRCRQYLANAGVTDFVFASDEYVDKRPEVHQI